MISIKNIVKDLKIIDTNFQYRFTQDPIFHIVLPYSITEENKNIFLRKLSNITSLKNTNYKFVFVEDINTWLFADENNEHDFYSVANYGLHLKNILTELIEEY